jgi:hypothetical protein
MSESWDAIAWILIRFGILSLIIERSLYIIFDSKPWRQLEEFIYGQVNWIDLKPFISIAVGILLVLIIRTDIVAALFTGEPTTMGLVLTGLYIAGGSKGVFIMLKRFRLYRDAANAKKIEEMLKLIDPTS